MATGIESAQRGGNVSVQGVAGAHSAIFTGLQGGDAPRNCTDLHSCAIGDRSSPHFPPH